VTRGSGCRYSWNQRGPAGAAAAIWVKEWEERVLKTARTRAAEHAVAVPDSPSGCTLAWYAVGLTKNGTLTF
jgi:hypothetical protein